MTEGKKKILITGATSFVACSLIQRLLKESEVAEIRCLVHTPENVDWLPENERVKIYFGDLRRRHELVDVFTGVDIVINIAPIFLAPHVVKLCRKTGVSSVLFISSTRKYSRLYSEQAEEIARCEEYIEQSSLNYVILRPTMIYGHPRERNISSLIRYVRRYRIIPLPNKGKSLVQPLFIEDLIDLICHIIREGAFWRKAYDVGGPTPLSAAEVFRIIGSETKTKFLLCLLPEWLSSVLCAILRKVPFHQRHIMQFLSFTEDRIADVSPVQKELNFTPRDFITGLRHYLKTKNKDVGRS